VTKIIQLRNILRTVPENIVDTERQRTSQCLKRTAGESR